MLILGSNKLLFMFYFFLIKFDLFDINLKTSSQPLKS